MRTALGVGFAIALVTGALLAAGEPESAPLAATSYAEAAYAQASNAPLARVVASISPAANSMSAGVSTELVIQFTEPLDASSFEGADLAVYGRWSGVMEGTASLDADGRALRFEGVEPFHSGEWVTASLRKDVRTAAGASFTAGYTWNFWIRPERGSLQMTSLGDRSVLNEGEEHVQPYGAYAGDFNGDGYSDLAIPNEVSGDVRVMLNDGNGNYADFTILEIPSGNWPSPNEGTDFNRDGIVDFVVGNAGNDVVTVFLGDGSGGFRVGQSYRADEGVRGVCILDLNSDGWPDVATANMNDRSVERRGSVSLLLNDGTGRLVKSATVPSPGLQEKTCATGDANGDGIEDLFVGAFQSGEVILFLGDGEGGLAYHTKVEAGGNPWMVVTADINGDGHVDVLSANRNGDNLAMIFGDGEGGLSEAVSYETGEQPLAIDVGDLDGDGDLDVVTSDFVGNRFSIFENLGEGKLGIPIGLAASEAGSCAIIHDRDRDGDLDITGVDEVDDKIFLFENPGVM